MFEAKVFGVELLFCFFLPIFLSVTLYFNQPPAFAIMFVKNFNLWMLLTFSFIISSRNIEMFSVNNKAFMFFRGLGYLFFFTLIFDMFRGYNPNMTAKKNMGFASSTALSSIVLMVITFMLVLSLLANDFYYLTSELPNLANDKTLCECNPIDDPEAPNYPDGEDCGISRAVSCAFKRFIAPRQLDMTQQVITPSVFYFWSSGEGVGADSSGDGASSVDGADY